MIRRVSLFLFFGLMLAAQEPSKGVSAIWDVRNQLAELAKSIREIEPLVRKVDPKMLADNGAPEAYLQQVKSVQNSVASLLRAADQLGREPEKLPVALEVYFQMERADLLMNSLREGIRKYQSPDLANILAQAIGKNAIHRDRLRQHIADLAELREQEYQIANEEAQRCRGSLMKQPVSTPERKAGSAAGTSGNRAPAVRKPQ